MGQPLNGTEIAKEIGISKQAVSFALRNAISKMYYEVQRQGYSDNPFDTVVTLMEMLQINNGSVKDIREFVLLLSKEIQQCIRTDATLKYNVL